MPQLDPVLIFFQAFSLIFFYLIFYFFFFRSAIFPLFFFNYKFNYYYTLQIYNNIKKIIYYYSCQIFYFKFIIFTLLKNLNYFYKNNLNFLSQIEICKNYKLLFNKFYENVFYFNSIKEININENILIYSKTTTVSTSLSTTKFLNNVNHNKNIKKWVI